jgi:hypothetical protein
LAIKFPLLIPDNNTPLIPTSICLTGDYVIFGLETKGYYFFELVTEVVPGKAGSAATTVHNLKFHMPITYTKKNSFIKSYGSQEIIIKMDETFVFVSGNGIPSNKSTIKDAARYSDVGLKEKLLSVIVLKSYILQLFDS